jgi:ABC-type nitrate/sulfonate/bicarbonate transport system permease component
MQRLTPWQMALHIYLPAIRLPLANGVRLGFGVAIVGVLLAETKLSNQGIGFLVMRSYIRFDMPRTYALLILVFAFAISINAALNRLTNHNQGGR